MKQSIVLFAAISLVAYAEYESQTDWSGGSGVEGPVITFSNEYFLEENVFCSDSSDLILETNLEHAIVWDYNGAYSVFSADINGDGYMDILRAAWYGDYISWWKNIDGLGTSWTEYIIDGNFDLQSDPDWQLIDWTCSTPSGTSVSFQVRASDDYTDMGIWSDTLSSPNDLEGILLNDDSYFQYRTILQTTDPAFTPTLNDVTIFWNPVCIGESTESMTPAIALLPIAPNPSAGSPVIRFGLPEPSSVYFSIFGLSGRLVSETQGNDYTS
jgi:hypothetical protein